MVFQEQFGLDEQLLDANVVFVVELDVEGNGGHEVACIVVPVRDAQQVQVLGTHLVTILEESGQLVVFVILLGPCQVPNGQSENGKPVKCDDNDGQQVHHDWPTRNCSRPMRAALQ